MRSLGLDHASWRSAPRANWELAGVGGILAGIVVFAIGTASGRNLRLGDDWKLIALQVTLGPVLEECVPRVSVRVPDVAVEQGEIDAGRNRLAVVFAAVVFAVVHSRNPVSLATIGVHHSTGTLYGWIRWRSGSTAPAAVSHAAYNLPLYAISGPVARGEGLRDELLLSFHVDSINVDIMIVPEMMEVSH